MKKVMIISLMIFGLMNAPQLATAEENLWQEAKLSAHSAWENTKALASEAADWTVQHSRSAWHTTSKAASEAAEWTGEKAQQGWHATREMAEELKS
ncbi:hypothetical protein MMIC_P1083 [Mariprofundus micogutta]|uniref:Late embryogenesis abundant protein n=1 Tax=Mariprofundus micogutta TaxID=1921010 RepID=A0A1L8CMI9_9PROT|nr:hypothetical protein [Mariprofundus micogutta]GAV20121.1 hypothetical protein MMIC_P1083 [Mariprofundus micogutta]